MLTPTLAVTLLSSVGGFVGLADQPTVSLTVYSSADPRGFDPQQFAAQQRMGMDPSFAWQVPGFGIVRETRTITLKEGMSDVPFPDVAAFIDPTTVSFTDLTDPATTVLEQNFQFDLVSATKLYERYLGQPIQLLPADGTPVKGTLLSATQGQFVMQTDAGVRVVPQEKTQVMLGELPGGLLTKPTLVWKLHAKQGGDHTIRTSYQTAGMTWRADYNLVLNAGDTAANLTPWVTLMNVSGASFANAQLKLVAGDVQVIQPQRPMFKGARGAVAEAMAMADGGFTQEQLFEYHLYTLPRPTDVLANTSQQLALFPPVNDVAVKKELVYAGGPNAGQFGGQLLTDRDFGGADTKVGVWLSFKNDEASKLGMPLPKGRVRVYKAGAAGPDGSAGSLEFVGEDVIDHTPRNGDVRLRLGNSFDVTAERVQTDFSVDTGRKEMSETIRITLKNGRRNAERVEVRESLFRWTNWSVTKSSQEFRKIDSRTIAFDVEVPAEGSKTVEYSVRYTW
ncbi:MAG: DUF4139 domain-containing protein [Phycisphaerae bacterium]|nr:DUF4139 domain-containing protein [Phycisphaerae bacterium]